MSCSIDPEESPKCPVDHDKMSSNPILNPDNNMPLQPEQNSQGGDLSIKRETSTIPMGGSHSGTNWIYPSEQMFYNAMKRKNWSPESRDMSSIIPIHNAVNEQCWKEILKWFAIGRSDDREGMHETVCKDGPKLLKFEGRPKDFTPKARLKQLMGYKLPFDRHDWSVDRCGTKVRYIIDFYSGAPVDGKPAAFFLDVRPEMSMAGVADRLKYWWNGI